MAQQNGRPTEAGSRQDRLRNGVFAERSQTRALWAKWVRSRHRSRAWRIAINDATVGQMSG